MQLAHLGDFPALEFMGKSAPLLGSSVPGKHPLQKWETKHHWSGPLQLGLTHPGDERDNYAINKGTVKKHPDVIQHWHCLLPQTWNTGQAMSSVPRAYLLRTVSALLFWGLAATTT